MKLSKLLVGVNVLNSYNDVNVKDICSNSNDEVVNTLFVCIKGNTFDSHNVTQDLLVRGALGMVVERLTGFGNEILVDSTKESLGIICKNYFNNVSEELSLVAVTGTNGKTSVASIINHIIGEDSGLISTIHAKYRDVAFELDNTTPHSYVLHSIFNDMVKADITSVCMEASSHALDQGRLAGLFFDIAVFTNLTQDHLDYHEDMEDYFNAKKKLFDYCQTAIINIDDTYGQELALELLERDKLDCLTCSINDSSADFYAKDIQCFIDHVKFTLCYNNIQCEINFSITGMYSVLNALVSIASCVSLGLSLETIVDRISSIEGIKGRCENIKTNRGFNVICDYAHTPDGIENILKSMFEYRQMNNSRGKLKILFGCGGDRDTSKRPLMGKVASEYADFLIITSDNPRTEKPNDIIKDILKGVPVTKAFIVIPDRKEAIRYAVTTAKKGDTIILAGKGHEQYQIFGDKKIFFDEVKLVKSILQRLF